MSSLCSRRKRAKISSSALEGRSPGSTYFPPERRASSQLQPRAKGRAARMEEREGRLASHRSQGLSETTLAHVYRAEVSRSTNWRLRLDATTNWSITITAAVVSYTFGSRDTPAGILLVGFFAVATFLVIEARRYRYYDIWARRVRMIESGYLVPLARREPVTV